MMFPPAERRGLTVSTNQGEQHVCLCYMPVFGGWLAQPCGDSPTGSRLFSQGKQESVASQERIPPTVSKIRLPISFLRVCSCVFVDRLLFPRKIFDPRASH